MSTETSEETVEDIVEETVEETAGDILEETVEETVEDIVEDIVGETVEDIVEDIAEETEEEQLSIKKEPVASCLFQPFLAEAPLMSTPLAFSIDSILSPEFGQQSLQTLLPVKEEPVDLRRQSDNITATTMTSTSKEDADCPPGMVRGPNGQLWPAWVFCTRYSDRPSSGGYWGLSPCL